MTSSWRVRGRTLSTERPLVMGIINATPDSFSDGGLLRGIDDAVARAEEMVAEGADILDVGGESTRPQARAVDADEELQRVVPLIEALARRLPDVTLSVDSVKSVVARAAIDAGACIVNDVSGFRLDPEMARTCAERHVGVVLMHSRGTVQEMASYAYAEYDGDPMDAVLHELRQRVEDALGQGIDERSIAVDPGIGFSKRSEHSLRVLASLERLTAWGYPVVVGASRKRFVGELSGVPEASARVHGSVGAAIAAFERGARILRVHDVAATRQALNVADAVRRATEGMATR
ncbi:MAG TPA: dihydropteroate synthase [Gemmatimonadaceae bacterium]|nr:dihydropteroate synthase [Gemmatimonadaceae bacterium]